MNINISYIFTVFFTIFIVIDPLGLVPSFIALTGGISRKEKRNVILKANLTAFVILLLFILFGKYILQFLGIKPGSFYIAGGVLLFIVSLDLLFGHRQRTKMSDTEGKDGEDIAIFPLGIPILAGPGTITTILLYVSESKDYFETELVLFVSVFVTLMIAFVTMSLSGIFLRIFKRTGVSIIQRLMGIILSGLSVQFIYEGLLKLKVIAF